MNITPHEVSLNVHTEHETRAAFCFLCGPERDAGLPPPPHPTPPSHVYGAFIDNNQHSIGCAACAPRARARRTSHISPKPDHTARNTQLTANTNRISRQSHSDSAVRRVRPQTSMPQGSDTQRSDRGLRRVRCPVWPCGVLAARAGRGVQPRAYGYGIARSRGRGPPARDGRPSPSRSRCRGPAHSKAKEGGYTVDPHSHESRHAQRAQWRPRHRVRQPRVASL